MKCCCDVDLGKIEPAEVKESLLRLGVNIDLAEAKRLTQRFVTVHRIILYHIVSY